MIARAFSITAALALCACTTLSVAPPISPALVAAGGGHSPAVLAIGRELFTGRCTACHTADPPAKYTIGEWREIVGDMAHRAKLSVEQQSALLSYIAASREIAPSVEN